MADKWTIGSNKEGLYNGINPSQKKGGEKRKEEKGKSRNNYCSTGKKTLPEEIYLIQDQSPRI